jgi:ATP-binding cassette subfamily D (ALD) long-chain fatty acid import protein
MSEKLPSNLSSLKLISKLIPYEKAKVTSRNVIFVLLFSSPLFYNVGKKIKKMVTSSSLYRTARNRDKSFSRHLQQAESQNPKKEMDKYFVKKLLFLLKIILPKNGKEMWLVGMQGFLLVLRTWLSLFVTKLDARLVKDLVSADGKAFLRHLGYWFGISIPASMIKFLQSKLSIGFRTRLTKYVQDFYFSDNIFYKVLNLDSRIENPDQLICTDINKFCDSLAALYSNLSKPVLDIVIFSLQLRRNIGNLGLVIIHSMFFFSAFLLKRITPSFGKLAVFFVFNQGGGS